MRARLLWPMAVAAVAAAPGQGLQPRPAAAAPAAELWPRWTAHDQGSAASIDHGAYAALLERYVTRHEDGINRVRYAAIRAEARQHSTPMSRAWRPSIRIG